MPRAKKKSTKAVGKLPRDLIALAVIAAGLFSLLSVFGLGTGSFGAAVADVVFAIFGLAGYVAPVVMIAAGWLLMISWRKQLHGGKIALLSAAICCSMIFLQLASHARVLESETRVADATGFFAYLVATIDYAKANHASGGAIGAVLSWPLWTFLGMIGAWIVSVTVAVGALAMLTKFSLGDASRRLTDKTKTLYNERVAPRRVREEPIEMEEEDEGEEAPRAGHREFHNVIVAKPRKPRKTAEPEVYDIGTGARGKLLSFDMAQEKGKKQEAALPEEATFDEPAGVLLPITEAVLEEAETAEPTIEPVAPTQPAPTAAGALEPVEEDLEKFAVDATSRSAKPYRFPALSLLSRPQEPASLSGKALREQNERSELLVSTLASFGIEAQVIGASRGPALTRYELRPAAGVKVSRITGLADDIAMNMAAVGVRIEAPIPGKAAIGIEVPNIEVSTVALREVLESEEFRNHPSRLAFALGKDITGKPVVADLARMPHVLIAGATGSGKSVCINSLVASILYKASPEEVKLIMVDPKVVELSVYNGIPHLLVPVVTDPKKAAGALNWAVMEMTDRYKKFADTGCRDLKGYNEYAREHELDPLAQLVVIIDELADLMMVASRDVEDAIQRLTQLARAAGIHLVIATQRPSVNVITGVIKSNIPSRIAFSVASQVDSRTILDMAGAEKLLGRGDMLYDPSGANKALRVQGCFITDKEVAALVDAVKSSREAEYDPDLVETMEKAEGQGGGGAPAGMDDEEGVDDLLSQAIELAIDTGSISTSMIQRRFRVGYARAGRLIDEMEQRGLISGAEGSKPRTTLISREEFARLYGPSAQEAE